MRDVEKQRRVFDTHTHLGFRCDDDGEARVQRAENAGVVRMLDVGIDVVSSRAAIARAARHASVAASVGLHPCDCAEHGRDFEAIEELAQDARCVAIGESGLDLYWDRVPLETQLESLAKHLELARRLDKPIILHCRDAFAELLDALRPHAPLRGILHCFGGGIDEARDCLELGLQLSFAGPLTYPKNDALREAAAFAPLDRIFVETDAPFLPPQSRRGSVNEPAFVVETLECLATLHGAPEETVAECVYRNSCEYLGVDANW